MNPEITELAIISLASGTVLGYLIGIIQHLRENGGIMSLDLY